MMRKKKKKKKNTQVVTLIIPAVEQWRFLNCLRVYSTLVLSLKKFNHVLITCFVQISA
jgi:hypothetical protein